MADILPACRALPNTSAVTAGEDPEQRIADLERAPDSAAQSEVASEGPAGGTTPGLDRLR